MLEDRKEPKYEKVLWNCYYRTIASIYPPIDLFEDIAPPEDWEVLCEIEALTNPRVRKQVGDLSLVPAGRRVNGAGASYVMSPFVHVSPERPSRFSDGRNYGVFYAAKDFETSIHEVAYHRSRFYQSTNDSVVKPDMRVLKGRLETYLHSIQEEGFELYHAANDYTASQKLGDALRATGSNGVLYNSVRFPGGACVAAFWPDVVGVPIQTGHVQLHWNGEYVDKYFDYSTNNWHELPKLI